MTDLPIPPEAPTTLVAAMMIAVVALAGVIVYLFRHFARKTEEARKAQELERKSVDAEHARQRHDWATERQEWVVERMRLEMAVKEARAEFETRHRELMERHAEAIRQLYDDAREAEATQRRDYTANMEVVAQKAAEAQAKVGQVLDKIYNRFIGTRSRSPH